MSDGEKLGQDRSRKLAKLKTHKGRREMGRLLLDSPAVILEALEQGLLEELIRHEECDHELLERATRNNVAVTEADDATYARLADVKTSFGLVGIARRPASCDFEQRAALAQFVVFLDHIADPGNLGTIVRSARAMGADLILLSPDCADPYSPKALRASAGAILRVELAEGLPTPDAEWPVFYRAVASGGAPIETVNIDGRRGVWLGNEAHGPRPVPTGLEAVDVTIDLHGRMESLNVAAAAAILCYVISR